MAATGPSDFHGDCGRGAERHGSRGQETGAGRQGGNAVMHIAEAAKKSPRTKIEDMEKANR